MSRGVEVISYTNNETPPPAICCCVVAATISEQPFMACGLLCSIRQASTFFLSVNETAVEEMHGRATKAQGLNDFGPFKFSNCNRFAHVVSMVAFRGKRWPQVV